MPATPICAKSEVRAVSPSSSLARLRSEFAKHGWTQKATGRILTELAVHVSLLVIGCGLFFLSGLAWLKAVGVLVSVLGEIGIISNTHTSSHHGTSSKRWVNEALTFFGYPFCLGFSASYWWVDHVKGHHPSPNVMGLDNDFDYAPFFALTEQEVAAWPAFLRRFYLKWQWLALFLLLPLFGFNLQRGGVQHVIAEWRRKNMPRGKLILDSILLAVHPLVFLGLPAWFFGWQASATLYLLRIALVSVGMYMILAPAHITPVAPVLTPEEAAGMDHCVAQVITTVNYDGGWLVRWLAGGLDFQIEHHLFPEISHIYYPKISPMVRQFCESHGLPYRRHGFLYAVWQSVQAFRNPRPVGVAATEWCALPPKIPVNPTEPVAS